MITLNHISIRRRSILPRSLGPAACCGGCCVAAAAAAAALLRGRLALRLGRLRKAVNGAALLAGELAAGRLAAHGAVPW